MSSTDPGHTHVSGEHDPIEDIVHKIPIVLPVAGGVLIFLLAFIAIYMA